jgi:hypothetical protein
MQKDITAVQMKGLEAVIIGIHMRYYIKLIANKRSIEHRTFTRLCHRESHKGRVTTADRHLHT